MNQALTTKQIENRRYYEKHAEQIKAQKRSAYARLKKAKPVCKVKSSEPTVKKLAVKTEPAKTVRSKIEDFKIARELGIEIVDL